MKDLKAGDTLEIKEQKTGKARRITLNKTCIKVIQKLLASKQYQDGDYLFQTQRRHVLTVPSVHKLVKGWCSEINLKGNYGSHILRKTWGCHQRVTFGVDLLRLMVCFNHSTQRRLWITCVHSRRKLKTFMKMSCEKIHYVTKLSHYLTNKNLK